MTVRVERIRDGAVWIPVSGEGVLSVQGVPGDLHPGDRIRVLGEIRKPSASRVPGSNGAANYLRGRRVVFQLRADHPASITMMRRRSPWNPRWWVPRLRGQCVDWVERFMPSRHRPLALAIFLGIRDEVDRGLVDSFLITGTIHLLSISGLHVGILAIALRWVFGWIVPGDRVGLWLTMAAIMGYATLAGGGAPVVRATILVIVFCLASIFRRSGPPLNSLASAGLVVLALNPTQLFDVGAQLSFLAVATLAMAAPWRREAERPSPLDRLVRRAQGHGLAAWRSVARNIRGGVALGTLIWMVSLPLVMLHFHVVSPVGILLNLVLALPFAAAMVSGFAMLALGWLMPPLGWGLGWVCGICLDCVVGGTRWGEQWTWGGFWVVGPTLLATALFYIALCGGQCFGFPRRRPIMALMICYGVLAGTWNLEWGGAAGNDGNSPACEFLAVGHGGCVCVEFMDGSHMVYDAGGMGSPRFLADTIARYLWSRRAGRIDALAISHADLDHFAAVPELLRRFSVASAYLTPGMWSHATDEVRRLCSRIEDRAARTFLATNGDLLRDDGTCRVRVLHPSARVRYEDDNAGSLVLLVEIRGYRVLLTGDLSGEGLRELLDAPPLDVDVLLAPHHGSASSDPQGICAWCTPEWVVISGGEANAARVVANYAACGVRVLHTALDGSVRTWRDEDRLEVACWKDGAYQAPSQTFDLKQRLVDLQP